jgi:hypothetical protein
MRGGRFNDLETRVRTAGAVHPHSLLILRDLSLLVSVYIYIWKLGTY